MADGIRDAGSSPRRRRRRRWIALACVLVLGAGLGRFAYLHLTLRPTPRPEYWEAQLAALDPLPPGSVPAAEITNVITRPVWVTDPAITSLPSFYPQQALQGPWNPPRPEINAVSLAFANNPAREDRRRILQLLETGWVPPETIPFSAETAASLGDVRTLGTWLQVHSRWAREETADPTTAVQDWLAALCVSRQLRRAQNLFAQNYESVTILDTAQEMALAAREGIIPHDTRPLAEKIEKIVGPPRSPHEILAGQRLVCRFELERTFVREGGQWLDVAETARLNTPNGLVLTWAGALPPSRLWNLTAPLFHDLPQATAKLDRYWLELEKGVDLVTCQQQTAYLNAHPEVTLAAMDGTYSDPYHDYGPELRTIGVHYMARCWLDAALTMLALEAFAERYEHYPETLGELVPEFLPRLPMDYADRQPLRYRRTEKGYGLYSIGVDGKDDHGWPGTRGMPEFSPEAGDVVFNTIRREPVNP